MEENLYLINYRAFGNNVGNNMEILSFRKYNNVF